MKRSTKAFMLVAAVALFSFAAVAQSNLVNVDFTTRGMQGGFFSGATGLKTAANKVTNVLAGSITTDFASSTITCSDSAAITVTGALAGDPCFVGPPTAIVANTQFSCYVSAADAVKVRYCPAGTAADPLSATYNVRVISNQ